MQLTFTTLSGDIVALELADDMELENVKALCEMDLRIPAANMLLSVGGRKLSDDKKSLVNSGLKNGDMILVENSSKSQPSGSRSLSSDGGQGPKKIPKIDFSSIAVPGTSQVQRNIAQPNRSGVTTLDLQRAKAMAEGIKRTIQEDPERLKELASKYPHIVDAVMRDDYTAVAEFTRKEQEEIARRTQMLITNPDSHEAQQIIQDQIRKQIIQENFEYAVEHAPESLASVHMLYVNCTLNGKKMKAFVDSGAQISIISREYAELCHIAHLIDDRFQGMAVGVGSQRFVGKIHACQLEIGGAFLATSFSVLDDNHMQILLGLDMLKRHQMVIDLKRNHLIIGTTGAETPFLPESEIPSNGIGRDQGLPFVPNETDIQALIAMGFSREKAREALVKCEGNKESAAAQLLNDNASGAASKS